ncbi:hypothetical protein SAMN00120144_4060 [Hymenobacter roseosalivarius DSM 11622]|uniref:Uncharacterized protein n=1 Tax=Hymenobacter roseosalivarius DSM 11622 TaxID=645990 RepID=A0A1W1V4V9_9BACT|nr:hypothetical protein SAMN00120144_4060 [Hymenobacter roseosalivarius DSM 11622]
MTQNQQAAEAITQEIVGDLLYNGHTVIAQDLRDLLAVALQGNPAAVTRIQAMANVRWLGDLYIESVPLLQWYQKLERLRRLWKRLC